MSGLAITIIVVSVLIIGGAIIGGAGMLGSLTQRDEHHSIVSKIIDWLF